MKKPEMIMFDYGHTLIWEKEFDPMRGSYAVFDKIGKDAGKREFFADTLYKTVNYLWDNTKITLIESRFTDMLRSVIESTGLGTDLSYYELEKVFWEASGVFLPMENVSEMLEKLYKAGIRTAVVSNNSFSARLLEGHINKYVPNHFEFILSSCDYIFCKPLGNIFKAAMNKSGVLPENTWYVGDNPIADMKGAHDSGMTPCFYRPGLPYYYDKDLVHEAPEDFDCIQFNNYREFSSIIDSLEQ